MSAADGTEASIEDILASIRQTFNEDPKPVAVPASATEPAGMPAFRSIAQTRDAAPSATAPLPTPPRSRAAAIDDELDGLIDKPAPKAFEPKLTATPASAAPAQQMSPIEAAREKWASLLNPGATPKPADPPPAPSPAAAPELKANVPPVAANTTPTPAAPSGLFAPRKGGFIPATESRADPVLPMPPAAAPISNAEKEEPSAAPPAPSPARSGFTPFWQSAPPASPSPTTSPPAAAPSAATQVDVPAASTRVLDDLVAELSATAPPAVETPTAAPAPSQPPPTTAAPAPTTETMAALALAAAERKKAADAALAQAAAPAPTPPTAVTAPATQAPPATGTPPPAAASAPASSRSFEDVVADMLRPLLEKWIDENMPRIVERALQRDATLGRKPNT